ncbi:hypothetical protein BDV25DRAFT_163882 [Aspergillus avenaceus]|uniref:Mucin n=1 Tax=Aspergillus avenaceus TaxID=36643 RepID=A0A5N6TI69_ASPAV|nr:hypothetical protein BDV25DRAFT_163882 [Aspergillus avenaceus]
MTVEKLEYESLPPALQRKFFSNVERLRLTQTKRSNDFDDQSSLACVPRRLPFYSRWPRAVISPNKNDRRRSQDPLFSNVSGKRDRLDLFQLVYLAVQVDSQSLYSLPPKIQRKFCSKEEQNLLNLLWQLRSAGQVFNAADGALHELDEAQQYRPGSCETHLSDRASVPISQSSTLYFESSDSDSISDTEMDDSLYDSFCRLDEGENLDLSLDEYHTYVADSSYNPSIRRRLSFRRTVSFNPCISSRKSSVTHKAPTTLAKIVSRSSCSRASSIHSQANCVPRTSTSSIDPPAQYYQDPEARFKLRAYLASPQNFDEAIEFGFPALKMTGGKSSKKPPAEHRPQPFSNTFFDDDDDATVIVERHQNRLSTPGLSHLLCDPHSPDFTPPSNRRYPEPLTAEPGGQFNDDREMTLKMTLTRPDLRAAESPPLEDSLTMAGPLLDDSGSQMLGAYMDGQGLVRKVWRRLRRQKV